jgi:hypothetical protein
VNLHPIADQVYDTLRGRIASCSCARTVA